MTTTRFSQLDLNHSALLLLFAAGIIACGSDSSGLKKTDDGGGIDGAVTPTPRLDAAAIDGPAAPRGTGGASGKLDAGSLSGTGGMIAIDGGLAGRGGTAGTITLPGAGGAGRGGATGTAGMPGAGGSIGGASGARTGGTVGAGGAAQGTGGSTRRDGGVDSAMDVATTADVAGDGPITPRDQRPGRADAIDGGEACGDLDEPCCTGRTCNRASLVCESGGGGSEGTCVACGLAGEPCCAEGVCTAPNTSCSGSGRSGGTCR